MRLIDADIIMVDLDDHADYADMLIKDIKEYIAEQPTVDAVEVRRGRWILGGEEGWPKWTCSVCGGDGRGDYKICPWCGARMDGGDKNAIS